MFSANFKNIAAERVFKAGELWIGLSSTKPATDGTNVTEPTSSNYSRKLISLGDPVDGDVVSTNEIEFLTGDDDWGTIPYYVIYDAQTGGNYWGENKITSNPTMVAGSSLVFHAGAIKFNTEDISTS